MSSDEHDKHMHFLIQRYEEVVADLNILKDAQLRTNVEIEKLTKVVFGLAHQLNQVISKLERGEKIGMEDWLVE